VVKETVAHTHRPPWAIIDKPQIAAKIPVAYCCGRLSTAQGQRFQALQWCKSGLQGSGALSSLTDPLCHAIGLGYDRRDLII